jgi:hypothetical protein
LNDAFGGKTFGGCGRGGGAGAATTATAGTQQCCGRQKKNRGDESSTHLMIDASIDDFITLSHFSKSINKYKNGRCK